MIVVVVVVVVITKNNSSSSGIHFSKSTLSHIKPPSFGGGKTEIKYVQDGVVNIL
jgi:hypothetical protein